MRQLALGVGQLRAAAVTVAAVGGLLVAALSAQLYTLPRVLGHDALVAENKALQAEITEVRHELVRVETLVARVQAYDERLRELGGRGLLPGFGPLDDNEVSAYEGWLSGVELPREVGPGDAGARARRVALELSALIPEIDELSGPIEQWAALEGALPQVWPTEPDEPVTSLFGWRRSPFNQRWKFHAGIDVGAHYGTPIYATAGGIVTFADWHAGLGRMVEIDHGAGISSRSGHASELLVQAGDEVLPGDVIALVGSSGQSTGAHLHYELLLDGEQVNPLDYLPRGE